MPSRSGGLPEAGEVWERTVRVSATEAEVIRFAVLEREGDGDRWSLRVYVPGQGKSLWPDASYWFSQGEFRYARMYAVPVSKARVTKR